MATNKATTKAQADSTTTTTAPAPTESPSDNKIQAAFNHFSQGKRHLLVEDFKSAVTAFKAAVEVLVEVYGEQAAECGDAYYHYGHALLELSRKEAGVLGTDLDGASSQEGSTEEEEEEEEEEESEESQEEEEGGKKMEEEEKEKGGKKMEEEEEKGGKKMEEEEEEKKKSVKKEEGEEKEEKKEDDNENNDKSEKKENTEGGGGNTEEEEDVSTLQCAWEWLDVARVIFEKQQQDKPEVVKKCAQIRLSLGEVCMESEDYDGAVNEFTKCLAMQEELLSKDDRSLAETHYQLGLAHNLCNNYEDACHHYTAAHDVIKLKINNLETLKEEKKTWTKERKDKELTERKDVFYTEEGEIEDLKQLLPDIQHKITDMKEMKLLSKERLQQAAKALLLGQGEGPGGSGAVFAQARDDDEQETSPRKQIQAKPLMCQVRRKRKPEDGETSDEHKKPRLENGDKSEGGEGENTVKPASSSGSSSGGGSGSAPKLICVKRKVTQNGKDSAIDSSSNKSESSSTKPDSLPSSLNTK